MSYKITVINDRAKYTEFCKRQDKLPIFFEPWWLDQVCGQGIWEAFVFSGPNDSSLAIAPICYSKKWGWKVIKLPVLTPYLGLWVDFPADKGEESARKRFAQKIIHAYIDHVPDVSFYSQLFHPQMVNCLPFYWEGYQQSVYYEQIIPKKSMDAIWGRLHSSVRNKIRKAQKKLRVTETDDINAFYDLNLLSFTKNNLQPPYDRDLLKGIIEQLKDRQRGTIQMVVDETGQPYVTNLLIWDHQLVYNLIAGGDPNLASSGCMQLLYWESIKLAITKHKSFSFCGSMMQNVERVNADFGAIQRPYFYVRKGRNRLIDALFLLRQKRR